VSCRKCLQPASAAVFYEAVSSVHTVAMILSILIAVGGVLFALAVYQKKKVSADRMAERAGFLYRGSVNKWYFDQIYDWLFVGGVMVLMKILRWFDENIIDGLVNGTASITKGLSSISKWLDVNIVDGLVNTTATTADNTGKLLSEIQTGKVQTYLVYIVFSFLVLFILFI
jgi:NADH-quinone oxidoreductase subunit L